MSKIKLFTHGADLDGIGCAILAYLAFGRENVDVSYCGYKDVDEKVEEFWKHVGDSKYDQVYITDISISDDLAERIGSHTGFEKWKLFDHHATALGLNKYNWCEVQVDDVLTGIKTCGTELFFYHLVRRHGLLEGTNQRARNMARFVDIVRDRDTWRWAELGEEGLVCKQVNDLFHIYGRDDFIDWVFEKLKIRSGRFPVFDGMDGYLLDREQKELDQYIAEKDKQLQVATDQLGHSFGWIFAERYFSEVGNRLCELHPELAYVAMIDISKGLVSFRTCREDLDLGGEIAHSLGGGGHKKAAGCQFDAGDIGTYVCWNVLNVKPTWADIMPQYMGEPVEKGETND